MEKVNKHRFKVFCPKCGQKLFRGNGFDIDMDCGNCGSNIDLEREGGIIRIVVKMQLPEG